MMDFVDPHSHEIFTIFAASFLKSLFSSGASSSSSSKFPYWIMGIRCYSSVRCDNARLGLVTSFPTLPVGIVKTWFFSCSIASQQVLLLMLLFRELHLKYWFSAYLTLWHNPWNVCYKCWRTCANPPAFCGMEFWGADAWRSPFSHPRSCTKNFSLQKSLAHPWLHASATSGPLKTQDSHIFRNHDHKPWHGFYQHLCTQSRQHGGQSFELLGVHPIPSKMLSSLSKTWRALHNLLFIQGQYNCAKWPTKKIPIWYICNIRNKW